MVCGNVYKQSLKEIWDNSPQFKHVRAVTRGEFPECMQCDARNYCAMCLVRNYNESGGDMFKINKHFCEVAFLNKKVVDESVCAVIEEYALKYEQLICNIYHCKRYGIMAADADLYRQLVKSYFEVVRAQNTEKRERELEKKALYKINLKEINDILLHAIYSCKCNLPESYEQLKYLEVNKDIPAYNIIGINFIIDKIRLILKNDKQ